MKERGWAKSQDGGGESMDLQSGYVRGPDGLKLREL